MLFYGLNANIGKPAGALIVPNPVFGPGPGSFQCPAFVPPGVAVPPNVASAMGGGAYVPCQIPAVSLLWDAITVGYGRLADAALLVGANVAAQRRVRRLAESRARLLRAIYNWPGGAAPGPVLAPEYAVVESSERRVVSFFIGQTVAQRLARNTWAVSRLFHRSLYGPLLPLLNAALPALLPGQSPDYLCLAPNNAVNTFGLVEAKGMNTNFKPSTNIRDREKLQNAFHQLAGVPGAVESAVSVACFDAKLPRGVIVGQFWDPPNPDPLPVADAGAAALTAEYFRRLYALLGCLGTPDMQARQGAVVLHAASVGFRIGIDAVQWRLLERLRQRRIGEVDFFTEITAMLPYTDEAEHGERRNGDGLSLELIDFD
jgi:hypothetical protein